MTVYSILLSSPSRRGWNLMVLPSLSICALVRFLTSCTLFHCTEYDSVLGGGRRRYFILFSVEGTTKCSNERIIVILKRKESFKGLIEEGRWLSVLKEWNDGRAPSEVRQQKEKSYHRLQWMIDVHLKTVIMGLCKYADRGRKRIVHDLFRRQQFKGTSPYVW